MVIIYDVLGITHTEIQLFFNANLTSQSSHHGFTIAYLYT